MLLTIAKKMLGRLVKKHGLPGLLFIVGDYVVKYTKTESDNEAWAKIKPLLMDLFDESQGS